MPMFLGISKNSYNFNRLRNLLAKKVNNKDIEIKIQNDLKDLMYKIEKDNLGIVPPKFVLEENFDVKTPADESL